MLNRLIVITIVFTFCSCTSSSTTVDTAATERQDEYNNGDNQLLEMQQSQDNNVRVNDIPDSAQHAGDGNNVQNNNDRNFGANNAADRIIISDERSRNEQEIMQSNSQENQETHITASDNVEYDGHHLENTHYLRADHKDVRASVLDDINIDNNKVDSSDGSDMKKDDAHSHGNPTGVDDNTDLDDIDLDQFNSVRNDESDIVNNVDEAHPIQEDNTVTDNESIRQQQQQQTHQDTNTKQHPAAINVPLGGKLNAFSHLLQSNSRTLASGQRLRNSTTTLHHGRERLQKAATFRFLQLISAMETHQAVLGDDELTSTSVSGRVEEKVGYSSVGAMPRVDGKQNLDDSAQSDSIEHTPDTYVSNSQIMNDNIDDHEVIDDRTLLDLFGEAAKEYLTQRVIPATNVECRWDWRSLRCEPHCDCQFRWQSGDYHLGRACRLLAHDEESDNNKNYEHSTICKPVDPALYWLEQPVTKRVVSLTTQTVDIVKQQAADTAKSVVSASVDRIQRIQENICKDLWILYEIQAKNGGCLPSSTLTDGILPSKSTSQKLLCGPIDFILCWDNNINSIGRRARGLDNEMRYSHFSDTMAHNMEHASHDDEATI